MTEIVKFIPGRLKNMVIGGHVAGAEGRHMGGGIVADLGDENYNVWASDDGFTGNGPQVFTVS